MIDLKAEQQATLQRPPYRYNMVARFFFWQMDLITGKKDVLPKAKLLEILACIPYREWEIRQYTRLTHSFRRRGTVSWAERVIEWGREAQDNEFDHLQVIHEKMKEEDMPDPWYLWPPITFFIVLTYVILSKLMAWVNINAAFHFNAQFEDHAERVYAQMVADNPQWEDQPVENELVRRYADHPVWADIFRRISLDERDHRNTSLIYCGKPELVAHYLNEADDKTEKLV